MRIGIDLGGTKIEGIVLAHDGSIVRRERIDTPRESHEAVIESIRVLVDRLEDGIDRCTIGIGTPGSISPSTGLLRGSNTTMLNGHPLDREIARALGREVRIANDANCFALSEASDGSAAGAPVVFGVILGTGCGGGLVVDGRVIGGRNGIAGEWGHNPLPWATDDELPGPVCWCGKRGCIEAWVSGPAVAADHQARTGERATAREIAERASTDEAARASLLRLADRLARALATVIDVLDPDVVVLGGGLSKIPSLYLDIPRLWQSRVFSDRCDTWLAPPVHGDASGVRGAAWLWPLDRAQR